MKGQQKTVTEGSACHNMNPLIHLTPLKVGITRHHGPPHEELQSVQIYKASLTKISNLNLTKSLELTSSLQEIPGYSKMLDNTMRKQTDKSVLKDH
jgi:hypothetical protein